MPTLPFTPVHRRPDWGDQIFDSQTARRGGIVRRAVPDVEREIGRDRLELEVRRRGFRLLEVGNHFVILCRPGSVRVIV